MSIRPTSKDVLLGRGGNNYAHEGNERLREIALSRAREYGASTKTKKGIISGYETEDKGGNFFMICLDMITHNSFIISYYRTDKFSSKSRRRELAF